MDDRGALTPISSTAVVAIAASAGSLAPLRRLLSRLPADFPAAVVVVQHRGDQRPELLPEILAGSTPLRVRHAQDGDRLESGTVYVCPPGVHMTAEHSIRLIPGPRHHHVRPSADALFESVARSFGERAIGVVLSGMGADGALGALAVTTAGGTALAQDPTSCAHTGMPLAALASGRAEAMPIDRIADVLQQLVDGGGTPRTRITPPLAESDEPPRTSVVLIDDHRIILDGVRALLRAEADIEVVGEAEDGRAGLALVAELSPRVVVMDIGMPSMDGIDATRRIKIQSPTTRVVALSARDDVRSALQILDSGAVGYVCKNGAFGELALAIRLAAGGRRYVSPRLAAQVDGRAAAEVAVKTAVPLTLGEREIVQLTVEGKTLDQIAALLRLDRALVERCRQRVMERLGIESLPALTRYALRAGLASIDG